MAKQKLEDLSDEALHGKKKLLNNLSYGLLAILVIYGIYMFYNMFNGSWNSKSPLISIPLLLMSIVLLINVGTKNINAELEKRRDN